MSQSLSGWDGVFHNRNSFADVHRKGSRNPFQGGMGFFTVGLALPPRFWNISSQSLSGWDGVFHEKAGQRVMAGEIRSQSLSGWDGVFHWRER